MPTCGFFRVQPDGMKQKDIGNKQRYDPVSKRMITIYPEIPLISEVTLSISQPTFVGTLFRSNYTVSFRVYIGCSNAGNQVRCSVYRQTGAQVASVSAALINGSNTLVLNGVYTPGGNLYYASIDYESSAFNSPLTALVPALPLLSNGLSSVSSANFYQNTITPLFFDNQFFWRGVITTEFLYYNSPTTATYTIANITNTSYPIVTQTVNLTYGRNTIVTAPVQIVQIPQSSPPPRSRVPYNTTETFSSVITIGTTPYSLPNIVFLPALIRDVSISLIGSYWSESQLYMRYATSFYYADGSRSAIPGGRSGELGILYKVFMINPDRSTTIINSSLFNLNNITGVQPSEENVEVVLSALGYYLTIEYDDPSFASKVTLASSTVEPIRPDYASPPRITSISNYVIDPSGLSVTVDPSGLRADFTITFDYQPPTGIETSVTLFALVRAGPGSVIRDDNQPIVRGVNNLVFTRPVIPGGYYSVSLGEGLGKVSTSSLFVAPDYGFLSFTRVPATVSITRPSYPPFTITIEWHNTIPGYSGGLITIATVGLNLAGLGSLDGSVAHDPGASGGATLTFNITPSNITLGNEIEQTLARSVSLSGGFSTFRFQITDDTTGISVLSNQIRSA